jgi:type III secretion protein L
MSWSDPGRTPPAASPSVPLERADGGSILRSHIGVSSRHRLTGLDPAARPAPSALRAAGRDMDDAVVERLRRLRTMAEERGYADGVARAEAELAAAITAAGAIGERLEELAPTTYDRVAHAVATLALSVARRVVAAELRTDPRILVRAIESGLESVDGSTQVRVLLHPDALEPVRRAWEAIHGPAFLGRRWSFDADRSLPAGGCVVHYDHGSIDVGLETQLAVIEHHLVESLDHSGDAQAGDGPAGRRVEGRA